MDSEIKILTLESKCIIARIEERFKEATRRDLFLIRPNYIYRPLESKMPYSGSRRVFGIKEKEEAVYALFLSSYSHDIGEGCDWDGNMRCNYVTEWVDSFGVLDINLKLAAWAQHFRWPRDNVSKLYFNVAKIYDIEKIKREAAKKSTKEKSDRGTINKSKMFIRQLEESLLGKSIKNAR